MNDLVISRMNTMTKDWDNPFNFCMDISFNDTRDDKFSFVVNRYVVLYIKTNHSLGEVKSFIDNIDNFYIGKYHNLKKHQFIDYFWIKTQYELYRDLCENTREINPIYVIDSEQAIYDYHNYIKDVS